MQPKSHREEQSGKINDDEQSHHRQQGRQREEDLGTEVNQDQNGQPDEVNNAAYSSPAQIEGAEPLTKEDHEAFGNLLASLTKMSKKIRSVQTKMPNIHSQSTVHEKAEKLIHSKQNYQITSKQDLLPAIAESYEKVVVEVYSENQRLKKKVDQLAGIIKNINGKLYEHVRLEAALKKENEDLRKELLALKDERLIAGKEKTGKAKEEKNVVANLKKARELGADQDYDFWAMPQNDSPARKRKEVVADSSLWANQKQLQSNVFLTEEPRKKLTKK